MCSTTVGCKTAECSLQQVLVRADPAIPSEDGWGISASRLAGRRSGRPSSVGIVLSMASNVWVHEPDEGRYIRGSEIIDARVHTVYATSRGQRQEQHTAVKVTHARTATEAGTAPREWDLWTFEARQPAERALDRLLAALATDPPAVVYLDANDEVQVQPLR